MYEEDTIAAIATPPGEGGVAIVRISGGDAERIAAQIFVRPAGKIAALESHRLYRGNIADPRSSATLDEVLLTIMRKPHSYTGEDVVEVHCHGGAFLVRRILGLILAHGAREAQRGEFTKRAFLNGKLDLAQAEAVLDLIQARTEKGAQLALRQAHGGLSQHVGELREELLDILVQVEAAIDFPEEEIELLQRPQLATKIDALADKIRLISNTYDWGRLFREGARVCICGRPNVGKSSLLNALLGADRVIVTPIPGTTRDVIEESINLDGLPVVLWDTAGIRETEDQVESKGVALTKEHLARSDAAIVVVDGSMPLTGQDCEVLDLISNRRALIAINKSDLPRGCEISALQTCQEALPISARTGAGIDLLKEELRKLLLGGSTEPPVAVTNVRHRSELIRSEGELRRAAQALRQGSPPELASVDLNEARLALEEIIGLVHNGDILERIFNNFCIGK